MIGSGSSVVPQRLTASTIIVVPCYNEELRLPRETFQSFAASHQDIAFLFVDDGSQDGTRLLLESLQEASRDSFAVLPLPRNGGKGEAVRQGLLDVLSSGAKFIGFWDADLATPLDELPGFIAIADRQPDVFLVMGARIRRLGSRIDRSILRHFVGRVFATLASLVLGLPVYDTQCGAKLMRVHPSLHRALSAPFCGRWTFDVELIQRLVTERRQDAYPDKCSMAHHGIVEVPLARWVDVRGSKVRISDGLTAFTQLISLWMRTWVVRP